MNTEGALDTTPVGTVMVNDVAVTYTELIEQGESRQQSVVEQRRGRAAAILEASGNTVSPLTRTMERHAVAAEILRNSGHGDIGEKKYQDALHTMLERRASLLAEFAPLSDADRDCVEQMKSRMLEVASTGGNPLAISAPTLRRGLAEAQLGGTPGLESNGSVARTVVSTEPVIDLTVGRSLA